MDDAGNFEQELKSIGCVQYYELTDKPNIKTANKKNLIKQDEIINKENKLSNSNKHNGMNLMCNFIDCMTLLWIYMIIILYTSQTVNKITHFLVSIVC